MEKIQMFGISIPVIYIIYLVFRLLINLREEQKNAKARKEIKYMSEEEKKDYFKKIEKSDYIKYNGIGGKIATFLFRGILGTLLIGGLIMLIITLIEYGK